MTKITINLPFPPSTNAIWRSNRGRVHISAKYKQWLAGAGWELKLQKCGLTIPGKFKAHLILDEKYEGKRDLDNHVKAIFDFCTKHGLIIDDRKCRALMVRWGTKEEAPLGARLTLRKC